ncbi:imelysin family protein [Dyadobacter sp. CY312]|uniref:imelysin family protein n=1 Tax=Dyadobacter sp. CY312 TaxID=2907303 RepID=UPI001F2681AF|nr:imelysin family protein [Dyadobacter sp. CY312]MCE7044606.1 hypothetical protein [Dyadobacter sp. CY312]
MRHILCFFLLLLLNSCKNKQPEPTAISDREYVVHGIGSTVIIQSFLDFQNSVNSLNHFVDSYTYDSTNTQKLLILRKEWTNTVISWKLTSIFLQGKLGSDIRSSNLYASANTSSIENVMSSNVPQFDLAYIKSLEENSTGLAAMEYLIFGSRPSDVGGSDLNI